jgi:hypothetical protein
LSKNNKNLTEFEGVHGRDEDIEGKLRSLEAMCRPLSCGFRACQVVDGH